jgi:iron complex transport system ATP-binding protein
MILCIEGVKFKYNGNPILEDVTFAVKKGEIVAILGPNGVGKTTLLRCINGILKPSSGKVMVEDRNVLKLDAMAVARHIGYVAQHQTAGKITAFDAILMGRRPHIRFRVSEKDLKIVDGAIRSLRLEKLALRSIDRMSGGELQKVAVGRAMVQEPSLLLLDEPTSSLDLKNQVEILKLIRRIVKEHAVCAVMTLHDLTTALRYSDKCLFLKNGAIHAAVGPREVTADIIKEVYDISVEIHHYNGFPFVIPH